LSLPASPKGATLKFTSPRCNLDYPRKGFVLVACDLRAQKAKVRLTSNDKVIIAIEIKLKTFSCRLNLGPESTA
jgi:hypothetical protein